MKFINSIILTAGRNEFFLDSVETWIAIATIFIIITIIEFIYILNLKDKINKNNSNENKPQ